MSTAKFAGAWPTMSIVAFFAANPDEMLTTSDMRAKFHEISSDVMPSVRRLARQGWLTTNGDGTRTGERSYTAGPVLLKTIGMAR